MAAGMTKTQLVRHIAEKHELSNKQVAALMESFADVAIKETKKNGVFVVPGLGRLVKSARKARMGRNPQTGEAIKIACQDRREVPRGQGCERRHRTRQEVAVNFREFAKAGIAPAFCFAI